MFPDNFLFTESINVLAMVIIGGIGSLGGVLLGATLIVALPEVFRDFQLYRMLVFGLALMVLMVFRPEGLLVRRRSRRPERPGGRPSARGAAGRLSGRGPDTPDGPIRPRRIGSRPTNVTN